MLADVVDAVVGVDTHRDTHQAEIATPAGQVIDTIEVDNHSGGFAELLEWITARAPGLRVAVAIEGTRSYGAGLARAAAAAGLLVIECEQPDRKARRGRGKSDPIDAYQAALAVLSGRATAAPKSQDLHGLRAVAATLVVFTHLIMRLVDYQVIGQDWQRYTIAGRAGVNGR